MLDRSWMRRIALAAAAGGVALALVAAPIAPGAALAKNSGSNGADHSGGKGGGKGHGKGHGGNSSSGAPNLVDRDSHGKGHTGHGKGHSKDAVSGVQGSDELEDGATPNMLGRLNAGHASPNAMANAASHSAVGLTAQYYDALAAGDEDVAAGFLADLANKEAEEDEIAAIVEAYNDLLGIEVDNENPDPVTSEPGLNDYEGFKISQDTEDDLIEAAVIEYESEIGGGLGPAPAPDPDPAP